MKSAQEKEFVNAREFSTEIGEKNKIEKRNMVNI